MVLTPRNAALREPLRHALQRLEAVVRAPPAFDAATILARTWLIAIGRQYAIDLVTGQAITRNQEMIGRCFAYDPVRASDAVFVSGSIRS